VTQLIKFIFTYNIIIFNYCYLTKNYRIINSYIYHYNFIMFIVSTKENILTQLSMKCFTLSHIAYNHLRYFQTLSIIVNTSYLLVYIKYKYKRDEVLKPRQIIDTPCHTCFSSLKM